MGLSDLYRLDIVTETDDGERWLLVAATGWPREFESMLVAQLLIKLANYRSHAEREGSDAAIELVSFEEPPVFLVELLTAQGVPVAVGEAMRPAVGRASTIALRDDGLPRLDELMATVADIAAERYDLASPPSLKGLETLDERLQARRAAEDLGPEDAASELEDGDMVVLGGAYAGEAMRLAYGGRWAYDTDDKPGMQPLHVAVGREREAVVNPLGKVRKFLQIGASESVAAMGRVVGEVLDRPSDDS